MPLPLPPSLRDRLRAIPWRQVLIVAGAVAALAVIAAGLHTWLTRPAPLPAGQYTAPLPERPVADLPRSALPVKQVQAYDKAAIVRKLPALAPEVARPNRQIIANADIPATRGGASAVAVLDTDTGESTILVREKPRPLVEFEGDGAVGLRYGINESLRTEGTIYGRWNVLRVGNVHLGAYAEVTTDAEATAQVGLEYRF